MDGDDDGSAGPVRPACWFCGEPEMLEIGEIWTSHDLSLNTCCGSLLRSVSAEMHADPKWARELLRRLGAEALTGRRLRRVCDGDGGVPMLDYKLEVRPISFRDASAFVRLHHAHCRSPTTWRFGASLFNGWTVVGVVMVGNPVAQAFMGRGMVEVNRLCTRRDLPPMLRADACSKLYSWSATEAGKRGFSRIISYTRADEDGASLRAAGWTPDCTVRARSWHGGTRKRSNANAQIGEIRWSRTLRPKLKAPVEPHHRQPVAVPDWMRMGDADLTPFAVPTA